MPRRIRPPGLVLLIWLLSVGHSGPNLSAAERGTQPLKRILFGSCAKQDKPVPIFNTMRQAKPDLLLFLGDNIYADTTDMKVMQEKYDKLNAKESFQRLVKACPVMATWDDHDYGANDAGADYAERKASQKLFLDFWKDPEDSPRRRRSGVYQARIFGPPGRRVQVIVLDTRYFRSPLKKGTRRVGGPYYPSDDRRRTMLGAAQWKWLEKQLREPAELRIVASSIQLASEAAGQETWSNLPHERARFIQLVKSTKANGVVIVSGDRHWAEISAVKPLDGYPLYDITASSFNQLHARGTPTQNRFREIPKTFHRENFGALNIDWKGIDTVLTFQILDLEGRVRIQKQIDLKQLRHP